MRAVSIDFFPKFFLRISGGQNVGEQEISNDEE